jgi:hypothetical protein
MWAIVYRTCSFERQRVPLPTKKRKIHSTYVLSRTLIVRFVCAFLLNCVVCCCCCFLKKLSISFSQRKPCSHPRLYPLFLSLSLCGMCVCPHMCVMPFLVRRCWKTTFPSIRITTSRISCASLSSESSSRSVIRARFSVCDPRHTSVLSLSLSLSRT